MAQKRVENIQKLTKNAASGWKSAEPESLGEKTQKG